MPRPASIAALLPAALAGLCACGAGSGDYKGGSEGDTAALSVDPCAAAGDYKQQCGSPATEAEYEACQSDLSEVSATCGEEAGQSYADALSSLYACFTAAAWCTSDEMTEAAFNCQSDFAAATEPYADCHP